jgi:hypothetical protein
MSYPARILTNPVETPEVGPAKICMQRGVITFAIRGTCEFSVAVEIVEFDPSTSPKQHKVQSAKQEPKEEKQKFTTSPFPIQQFQCDGDKGLKTALGCIPIQNTNEFAGWFLRWAIGIAGGVAFLLMVWGGFQIMTASGNLEQVQHGRETITSAVAGLIFIIFSVFLLQLIGVQILGIPGL